MSTNQPLSDSKRDIAPTPKLRPMLYHGLPWAAFSVAFVTSCHAADVQTLAEATTTASSALENASKLWLTVPAACAAGLVTGLPTDVKFRFLAAAVGILLVTLLALMGPVFLYPLLAVPVAVIAAHVWLSVRRHNAWRPGLNAAGVLAVILTYSAYRRNEMFLLLVNTAPDPDVGSYLTLAKTATGWATTFREPFYVWVLQFAGLFAGEITPVMMRLTSAFTGLCAVASIFYMCRRHLNLAVAIIAASLYAGQEYPAYTAVRGLREDAIVCLAMLFISIGWSHLRGAATWKSLTLWSAIAAASSLLRISSFSFVLVLIALTAGYRFYVDIKPWRQRALWLIPAAMTVVLMVPYFVHCKQVYNDANFVVNYAARYYANEEFGGKRPDFPTREELAVDAYAGPKMTPREYIFGYHTISEIASRTWQGFVKTFFGSVFKIAYQLTEESGATGLLYILHFAGIALLLFPARIYLILAMLLFHGPIFFLAAADSYDPR